MNQAHCLTEKHRDDTTAEPRTTSNRECGTIRELLAGQALNALPPDVAGTVGSHLAVCPACRDEHDCLAAVAAHLSGVRDALARGIDQRQRAGATDRAGCRHLTCPRPRRRGPVHAGPATRLTLDQWVSRITYVR